MKILQLITGILPKSSFTRSVFVLSGGTALGQGLLVLATPVLTRIYNPEEFGVLAVYVSILSMVVVFASLRYELAIPLPDSDEKAVNLLIISFIIILIVGLALSTLLILCGNNLVQIFDLPHLKPYLWIIPFTYLGLSLYEALGYWALRKKYFWLISRTRVVQVLGQASIQIAGGLWSCGALGLLIGYTVSRYLGILSLLCRTKIPFELIAPHKWMLLVRAYKQFPLYTLWASLINVSGFHIPPLLFAAFFSLDITGKFALTMGVLGVPSLLIAQAVGKVFYSTIAEVRDEPTETILIEKLVANLYIIGFIVYSFIGLYGSVLFTFAFGSNWESAGRYAQYLAPWFALSFISSPLSTFVLLKGKNKTAFFITTIETVLRVGAIWVGARCGSPNLSIIMFGTVGVIISVIQIAWVLRLANSSLWAWFGKRGSNILLGWLLLVTLFCTPYSGMPLAASLLVTLAALVLFGLWFAFRENRKGSITL